MLSWREVSGGRQNRFRGRPDSRRVRQERDEKTTGRQSHLQTAETDWGWRWDELDEIEREEGSALETQQ